MASESGNQRERPKTTVAAPKPATAAKSTSPPRLNGGRCARASAMPTAPTEGAARSTPRPTAPTCRMSSAKIGKQRRRAAQQHREEVERDCP